MKKRIGYISVSEATKATGLTRYNIMRAFRLLKLGEEVINLKTGRSNYYVGIRKLAAFTGIPAETIEERVEMIRKSKKPVNK